MSYKLHHWQSLSEDEAWCHSGYDLLNVDNFQQAVNKVGCILVERMKSNPPPNLKIFILPYSCILEVPEKPSEELTENI